MKKKIVQYAFDDFFEAMSKRETYDNQVKLDEMLDILDRNREGWFAEKGVKYKHLIFTVICNLIDANNRELAYKLLINEKDTLLERPLVPEITGSLLPPFSYKERRGIYEKTPLLGSEFGIQLWIRFVLLLFLFEQTEESKQLLMDVAGSGIGLDILPRSVDLPEPLIMASISNLIIQEHKSENPWSFLLMFAVRLWTVLNADTPDTRFDRGRPRPLYPALYKDLDNISEEKNWSYYAPWLKEIATHITSDDSLFANVQLCIDLITHEISPHDGFRNESIKLIKNSLLESLMTIQTKQDFRQWAVLLSEFSTFRDIGADEFFEDIVELVIDSVEGEHLIVLEELFRYGVLLLPSKALRNLYKNGWLEVDRYFFLIVDRAIREIRNKSDRDYFFDYDGKLPHQLLESNSSMKDKYPQEFCYYEALLLEDDGYVEDIIEAYEKALQFNPASDLSSPILERIRHYKNVLQELEAKEQEIVHNYHTKLTTKQKKILLDAYQVSPATTFTYKSLSNCVTMRETELRKQLKIFEDLEIIEEINHGYKIHEAVADILQEIISPPSSSEKKAAVQQKSEKENISPIADDDHSVFIIMHYSGEKGHPERTFKDRGAAVECMMQMDAKRQKNPLLKKSIYTIVPMKLE